MKRIWLVVIVVALLFSAGCAENTDTQSGYIYRHDLEISDFAFLFDKFKYEVGMIGEEDRERKVATLMTDYLRYDDIGIEDIFNALGMPYKTTDTFGPELYYLVGDDSHLFIRYDSKNNKVLDIGCDDKFEADEALMQLADGDRTIDRDQSMMEVRFDITIDDLAFIDDETDSLELQQALGAPHHIAYYREATQIELYSNLYGYTINEDKQLVVAYYRNGYIYQAWLQDENKEVIKVYIDRVQKDYYESKGIEN